MPKVNKTMLDKLVDVFKGGSQRKPEIIQTEAYGASDPLYGSIQWKKTVKPSMTPERVKYQKGIDARLFPRMRKADELVSDRYDKMDEFKDEWSAAVEEAKSDMADDWASTLDYQDFDEVNPEILERWLNDKRHPGLPWVPFYLYSKHINRRAGRVNAAIMNLARQGYTLPEIREILRRQRR